MRKAYIVTGIIICFILAIGCGLFLFGEQLLTSARARQPSPIQTRILPDGKVVVLNAVEYGSSLEFKYTIPGADSAYNLLDNSYSVVSDEHGCWVRQGYEMRGSQGVGPSRWLWFDVPASPSIRDVTVDAFPRRGERVILTLFDRSSTGADRAIIEFSVPNPDPGPHPTWEAKPLPATQQAGDLAFTLTDLRAGVNNRGEYVGPGKFSSTQASFRITEKGKPSGFWAPVRIVISDATGNRLSDDFSNSPNDEYNYKNGERRASFLRILCPEEVWKLDVEFAQTADSPFPSEALWTVPDVSIPGENTLDLSDKSAMRMGRQLRFVGIGGPGNINWPPDDDTSGYWKAVVRARVSAPYDDMRLSLIATDERGRRFFGTSQGYRDISGDKEREFTFYFHDLPDDVKVMNLTFALHQSHHTEFLAKPAAR